MRRTTGFAFTEILLALAIVAFALVPLYDLIRSVRHRTAFSDFNVFWQVRAMRTLEHFRLLSTSNLRLLASAGAIPVGFTDTPLPPDYARKLRRFTERLELTYDEATGLATLTAVITWSFPNDPPGKEREYRLACVVSDNSRSLVAREELPL